MHCPRMLPNFAVSWRQSGQARRCGTWPASEFKIKFMIDLFVETSDGPRWMACRRANVVEAVLRSRGNEGKQDLEVENSRTTLNEGGNPA